MSEARVAVSLQMPTRGSASKRFLLVGGCLLAALVIIALLAPWIAPHDPQTVEVRRVLGKPDRLHPFGSDVLGRDVFSRVVYGLRVSLLVTVSAVAASLAVAVPLGLAAGYFGRWIDTVVSRSLDMILIFPAMLLAVTFIAVLGPGSVIAALAIAVIYLPILARVMRTSTLVVLRVLATHVAPNALGPVVVQASVLSAFALQLEAGLSFLGLGTQPPTPSLGGMLADGRDVLSEAPWVEVFPGLAIVVAVLAFAFLGEGLRRVFDTLGVAE
jgi:peptide/nickel transport system permease protein